MWQKSNNRRLTRKRTITFAVGLFVSLNSVAFAQTEMKPNGDLPRVTDMGWLIEPSLRMRGKNMPWDHEIRIALPQSYDPKAGKRYPVLWVTDGNVFFEGAVAEVAYAGTWGVPEMIVVGVGPPPDSDLEFVKRRSYEFSASADPQGGAVVGPAADLYKRRGERRDPPAGPPLPPPDRFGGASNFLSFLVNEIRPVLANRYRLADDNTLYGFSGGGMFCETVLFTRPESFDRYICSSGVVNNRSDGGIFRLEEAYAAKHKDLKAKLFLSVGEREAINDGFEAAQLFTGVAQLGQILRMRDYPSLDMKFKILSNEVHNFGHAMRAIREGLLAVYPTVEQPTGLGQYRPIMAHGRRHPAQRMR